MELGLHLADFTWPAGPQGLGKDLAAVARAAEDCGFTKLSVMDHVWQIGVVGPPEHEMLEAYTALGYLAACTSRIDLLAWVTAVVYREPGLLAKCVTTLDVMSGGRAWLGIGAAWNAEESRGLGLPFPPTAERFERLEETLQMVAQYAQACNLFAGPELEHKLDVLREHCEVVGRDYDDIIKTVMMPLDPGENGEHVDDILEQMRWAAGLGVS